MNTSADLVRITDQFTAEQYEAFNAVVVRLNWSAVTRAEAVDFMCVIADFVASS
jgi:hypothetical protein